MHAVPVRSRARRAPAGHPALARRVGRAGFRDRREVEPTACDPRLPARLAEIGVYGLGVPERFGGAGFGLLELGVVFQEAGRAAFGAPLLSPVLAADLLLQAAGSATAGAGGPAGDILARIAAGELIAAPAIAEGPLGWDVVPATTATAGGSPADWTLDGTKDWVQDGSQAGLFVVSAASPDGPALFAVEAGAPGLAVEPVATVDVEQAVRAAAPGRGRRPPRWPCPTRSPRCAAPATGASRCSAPTTSASRSGAWRWPSRGRRTAEQFGQAIGSFQAVKHKLASVRLELEAAEAACMYALWAARGVPGAVRHRGQDRRAHLRRGGACWRPAENIQVHGGIGATWEHPAHVYLRRATAGRRLLADPQALLEDLAQVVEDTVFVSTAVPAA